MSNNDKLELVSSKSETELYPTLIKPDLDFVALDNFLDKIKKVMRRLCRSDNDEHQTKGDKK